MYMNYSMAFMYGLYLFASVVFSIRRVQKNLYIISQILSPQ